MNRQDGHDVAFEELEGRKVLGAAIEDLGAISGRNVSAVRRGGAATGKCGPTINVLFHVVVTLT
jgi:hypothetical protein